MRFYGKIGFWVDLEEQEVADDIWRPTIVEKPYRGELLKNYQKIQDGKFQNDEFTVSNKVKILADMYFNERQDSIKYVEWKGIKWKVTSIEPDYPSVILTLGGVYNEETLGVRDDIQEDLRL